MITTPADDTCASWKALGGLLGSRLIGGVGGNFVYLFYYYVLRL